MSKQALLLTGVTGALGREIIREILATGEEKLYLLVRRKGRYTHWDRARKILTAIGRENLLGTRVEVLEGDVALEGLGLAREDQDFLRGKITQIYHIAAVTALNAPEEECLRVNLGGTEHVLEMARDFRAKGHLERLVYFSTAFVAGSLQDYCAKEDELPERPAHANFYESSKYAAEKKVREATAGGLPATILRPSIVVGHSGTGEVAEFNVIYPFIKLFAHGILRTLPTRLEHSFNVVPIDFVARASIAIARRGDSAGRTFHLVTEEPPTIGMLLKLRDEEYPEVPETQVVDPDDFRKENLGPAEREVYAMLEPYLGYLNGHLSFDVTNARSALKGSGIDFPRTDYEFLKTLVRYAFRTGYLVTQ